MTPIFFVRALVCGQPLFHPPPRHTFLIKRWDIYASYDHGRFREEVEGTVVERGHRVGDFKEADIGRRVRPQAVV